MVLDEGTRVQIESGSYLFVLFDVMCEYYNAFRMEVISCSKMKNAIRFFDRHFG